MKFRHFSFEMSLRCLQIACPLLLILFLLFPASETIAFEPPRNAGEEGEATSGSILTRMRINLDGGIFFPFGDWSDGFDPGISVGAGVDLPLKENLDIGGRVSWFSLGRDELTNLKWLSAEAQATFFPPVDITGFEPFVLGRAGLLRAALEVGEGREDEWDLLVGTGGGIVVPISDRFDFVGTVLWRKVLGEGQGFHFTGGLSFPVF